MAKIFRHLSLQPFDASSEQGRSDERYRLALWSMIFNVGSRLLSMATMVLGVSLTVPYLGAERFGVWMTVASFSAMLTFLDLGVGNALTNQVASCATRGDPAQIRRTISGGLGFMALLGSAMSALLYGVCHILPWQLLIKTNSIASGSEAVQAATLFGVLFGVSLFTTGIQKVFAGLQRAFEAHVASAIGSLLAMGGLIAATDVQAGIPHLLLVTLGSQLLAVLSLLWLLFRRKQLSFRTLATDVSSESPKLLKVGTLFFALQIGTMVGWGADSLIISSTLGASHVAVYGVMQRLVQFVSIPLSILNGPLWAAYADAHVRQDGEFVRKTLKRSAVLTLSLAAIGATVVALTAEDVIRQWTHGAIIVPVSVVTLFCIWVVFESAGNAFAMFLNGCGIIRPQVVSVVLFCILVTPMKFFFTARYGVTGTLCASIGCYILAVPMLYLTVYRKSVLAAYHGHERPLNA